MVYLLFDSVIDLPNLGPYFRSCFHGTYILNSHVSMYRPLNRVLNHLIPYSWVFIKYYSEGLRTIYVDPKILIMNLFSKAYSEDFCLIILDFRSSEAKFAWPDALGNISGNVKNSRGNGNAAVVDFDRPYLRLVLGCHPSRSSSFIVSHRPSIVSHRSSLLSSGGRGMILIN